MSLNIGDPMITISKYYATISHYGYNSVYTYCMVVGIIHYVLLCNNGSIPKHTINMVMLGTSKYYKMYKFI